MEIRFLFFMQLYHQAGKLEVQMPTLTLPYDMFCESGEQVVAPIPDRTFGALLETIAQGKGNNIMSLPLNIDFTCLIVGPWLIQGRYNGLLQFRLWHEVIP